MKELILARWRHFSGKEQSILAALFLLILSLIIYAFVWLPIEQGSERLSLLIPDKKNRLFIMQSQAAEIERLRGKFSPISSNNGGLKTLVEVSAKVNGLAFNQVADIENTAPNHLKITLSEVRFDAWFKWIESLQSQNQVKVQFCQIKPSAKRGLVNIELTLNAVEL